MLSKVSVDEVFNALFSEHVVSVFVTGAPPLDAAGGLLSPDPLICPPWKKSCAKHNGLSCIDPTHGPIVTTGLIPRTLGPSNDFALLNGWICLHGVLD